MKEMRQIFSLRLDGKRLVDYIEFSKCIYHLLDMPDYELSHMKVRVIDQEIKFENDSYDEPSSEEIEHEEIREEYTAEEFLKESI